jgi:hypothetical protein
MSEILGDEMAVSLARCVAVANRAAKEKGVDPAERLLTIDQVSDDRLRWRIHYGAKNYVNRRGGDLVIDVDAVDASIQSVLRGQ